MSEEDNVSVANILYDEEYDIVLHPFARSGTTGIPCIRNNRTFIGVERENEYYELMKTLLSKLNESLNDKVFVPE